MNPRGSDYQLSDYLSCAIEFEERNGITPVISVQDASEASEPKLRSRAHVIIGGRVQGVSFRYFTREKAASIGLKGWVRNLRDGRVELEFEGLQEAVEVMIEFCREGPRWAKVTTIEVTRLDFSGKYADFQILI